MKKLKLFCIFAPSNALTDMKKLFSICLMVTLLTIAKAQQVTLNIEASLLMVGFIVCLYHQKMGTQ